MFTDQDFYNLFEEIAIKNKALAHTVDGNITFFKTPDEVPEKDLADRFYMALLQPEYEYVDRESDNLIERFRGAFIIFKPVHRESYSSELNATSECRNIARQIMAYLKVKRLAKAFNEFSIGNTKGTPIGPILENCFGVSYTFTIGDPAGIVHDPSNWFD